MIYEKPEGMAACGAELEGAGRIAVEWAESILEGEGAKTEPEPD